MRLNTLMKATLHCKSVTLLLSLPEMRIYTCMQAGNTALRQLLHMPRHPAVLISSAPQLRPPPSQQQVSNGCMCHKSFQVFLQKFTSCLPSWQLRVTPLPPLNAM